MFISLYTRRLPIIRIFILGLFSCRHVHCMTLIFSIILLVFVKLGIENFPQFSIDVKKKYAVLYFVEYAELIH